MKNKVILSVLLVVCLMLFSGCNNEPKTLYQSESVEVVRNGNITTVFDLVTAEEYSFHSVRVKRSEAITEPYTPIDTDTIKIDIIPSGLRVYDKAEQTIFTIQRKYEHKKGCLFGTET